GRRKVHDAGIEREPVIETFADIVVDWDIAGWGRQHLAASSRRRPEHHIAVGECVAYRRHLSGLSAEDVKHANSVTALGHLAEGADTEVIGKSINALLVHARLFLAAAQWTCCRPKCVAISFRPPAFIHSST